MKRLIFSLFDISGIKNNISGFLVTFLIGGWYTKSMKEEMIFDIKRIAESLNRNNSDDEFRSAIFRLRIRIDNLEKTILEG